MFDKSSEDQLRPIDGTTLQKGYEIGFFFLGVGEVTRLEIGAEDHSTFERDCALFGREEFHLEVAFKYKLPATPTEKEKGKNKKLE
jgi:hypothetical protein